MKEFFKKLGLYWEDPAPTETINKLILAQEREKKRIKRIVEEVLDERSRNTSKNK